MTDSPTTDIPMWYFTIFNIATVSYSSTTHVRIQRFTFMSVAIRAQQSSFGKRSISQDMRCFSILRVNGVVLTTTNRPPVWDDFEIFVPHQVLHSGKSKFQIHAFNTNGDFLRIIHKEYYCPRMFHVSKKFQTDGSTVDVVHMNTVLCDELSQHVRQDGLKFIECMNRHEPCFISVLSPVDGRCLFKIQTHFSRGCLSMDSTPAGQLVVCSDNGEVGIFQ